MDYEKKYEEALERAREQYNKRTPLYDIEYIFPELKEKESKGKRIRKELIEQIAYIIPNNDEVDDEGNALPSYQERINKYRAWLEKQGEQKSVDKVEPKFKVDDWFVNNKRKDVFLIKSINTNRYCTLEDIKGNIISPCLPPCESDSHIWTIKDAKDGDVLIANVQRGELGYDDYPFRYIPITFIYRKTDNDNYNIHSYCGTLFDDILRPSYGMFAKDFIRDIHPAAKEQQDLLFAKMKEAGYEWDAEKKEVKQIEPKKLDADKVIEWLKNTIKETEEYFNGVYYNTRLTLPYNSIEDLINDFKEDFGL